MLPLSVFVFDNRIEVVSYGTIPYGLTKDGFLKEQACKQIEPFLF